MPHHDVIAQCPYYERENQTTIFCETNFKEKGIYSARVFDSAKEKTHFMKKHCARYPDMRCPYAEHMNQVYMKGDIKRE